MVEQSMRRALSAIGIYGETAPYLRAELKVYALELENLYNELEQSVAERFLHTATDEGLKVYEEMFGPERSDLSAQERRRLLRLRMNLGEGDFTPRGIRNALDSFGLDYTISEFPALNRLNIIAQANYSEAQEDFIRAETQKIIPAHIEYQLVFNTLSWSQLDARDKSFSQLDGDNMTWEQLDSLR